MMGIISVTQLPQQWREMESLHSARIMFPIGYYQARRVDQKVYLSITYIIIEDPHRLLILQRRWFASSAIHKITISPPPP